MQIFENAQHRKFIREEYQHFRKICQILQYLGGTISSNRLCDQRCG